MDMAGGFKPSEQYEFVNSIGIIIPNILYGKNNVANHQPDVKHGPLIDPR